MVSEPWPSARKAAKKTRNPTEPLAQEIPKQAAPKKKAISPIIRRGPNFPTRWLIARDMAALKTVPTE